MRPTCFSVTRSWAQSPGTRRVFRLKVIMSVASTVIAQLRAKAALEAHHSAQRTISGNGRRRMGHPDRRGMPAIVR